MTVKCNLRFKRSFDSPNSWMNKRELLGVRLSADLKRPQYPKVCFDLMVCWFMVSYATFNNISAISWQSVLLVEETGVSGENQRFVASH